jgi:hypothetical protein
MEAWEQELRNNLHLFEPVKKVWQPDEMAIAYRVYNGHYGTALRDTGCGSCRRSVLAHCLKIAEKYREQANGTP